MDGSNFSKLNKYVISDFPKYPKELAHILDQWPAKFHFEIRCLFLLSEAQNVSGNKETLQRIRSCKLYSFTASFPIDFNGVDYLNFHVS